MYLAYAELTDHLAVEPRAISFVQVKTILRICSVSAHHHPVARHFCDDGGGRDQRNLLVALDDSFLPDAVGQSKPAVQKRATRALGCQCPVRAPDSAESGARDIDAVNHRMRDRHRNPLNPRMNRQAQIPLLSRLRIQFF